MKTKIVLSLFLSVFAVLLLASFASAALTLTSTSSSLNITHGSSTTVTVSALYDGTCDPVNLTWSATPSTLTFTLPTLASLAKDTSTDTTFTIAVPSQTSAQTINATLHVSTTCGVSPSTDDISFSVIIPESKSLTVSDATISSSTSTASVTITNTGNVDLSGIALAISGSFSASVSPTTLSLAKGASSTVTVTTTEDLTDLLGSYVTLTASATGVSASGKVYAPTTFCEYSDNGNLDISIEDISVVEGFGEDDEWMPLDEIEVELEVENSGDDDIKKIEIKWGVYDASTSEWLIDEEESTFTLNDGDSETVTINFVLDEDIDKLVNGDLVFYARATGEDEEYDGNETCSSASSDVSMISESNFVVLNDIQVPELNSCGSNVQLTAKVWNVGDEDQDSVSVRIRIDELGIDETVEVGDIDAFEDESLNFNFDIPKDATEKIYTVKLSVLDEDNDIYENDYNEDDSEFTFPLEVKGSCSLSASSKAVVNAVLDSDAKAGKELIVKATITNTGDSLASYTINAADYTSWADSVKIDQTTLALAKGESKVVVLTFNVKSDASGENSFNVEVLSDSTLVTKQPVSVSIDSSKVFGITGASIFGGNWYLWGIGALNVILVLIIIIVAVRVARS